MSGAKVYSPRHSAEFAISSFDEKHGEMDCVRVSMHFNGSSDSIGLEMVEA